MGWQNAGAALDPLRAIEIAEVARTLDPMLVASLDAEPQIAVRAALAIGRTKNSSGAAALRAHLTASVPGVRAMCAYALGLLADAASLDSLRLLARNDPNSAVRYAAVDALGRIALANPPLASHSLANDTLIVALGDSDATVRGHAAAQLDVFRAEPFAATIAAALERAQMRETDEDVRWHIAWVIFRGYAQLADPAFLTRALHDANELVRVEAARAWGRRSDANAAAIVRTALDDPSWRVQFEAREALRHFAKEPATDHLVADPPGIHLPPIPVTAPTPPPLRPAAAQTPPPVETAASQEKPAAPDPRTLEITNSTVPVSASQLNAPRAGPHPRVRIATTKGDVVVRLYPEWAPVAVANFLLLTQRGYFNGNRWFRIVPDFVVQTGDPTGNGEGDAGYTIPAEENPIEERTAVIAMGLNYDGSRALRDSAGTQFYVTLSPQLHLDRDFSVFGEIESGFEVLAHLIESDRILATSRISDG